MKPTSQKKIRLLMVDDHPVVQSGVRKELSRNRNILVVGEAQNGDEALKLFKLVKPDVVLLDVSMPRMNGAEVVKRIRTMDHKVKILMYTVHHTSGYVIEFARLGVFGYIDKSVPMPELIKAIQVVASGEKYFPGFASQAIFEDYARPKSTESQPRHPTLTQRELQILEEIAQGKSNKAIASELRLSVRTIETHRAHIKKKLGLSSTAELTQYAIRSGTVTF